MISADETGADFTPALLEDALFERIRDLDRSNGGIEWLEAVEPPCDSFEIEAAEASGAMDRNSG